MPGIRCYSVALAYMFCSLCFPFAVRAQQVLPQIVSRSTPEPDSVAAQHSDNSAAKFATGRGNSVFLAAGALLPLLEDGPDGKEHVLRTADSLLTSTLLTEGLKRIVREKRPNSEERTSFPSGHATSAFALAAMQAHYHPRQAWFWYSGATLISYSRVKLIRHYYQDIAGGAAIGYLTARFELSRRHGLIFAPFIKSRHEGGSGWNMSVEF